MILRPSLLIIEDAADIRLFIRLILQAQFEIVEAASGEEGLALLSSRSFNAVITDLMMPGISGRPLIEALLAAARCPLVAVSADKLTLETLARDFPAIKVLSKPFVPATLRTMISEAVAGNNPA